MNPLVVLSALVAVAAAAPSGLPLNYASAPLAISNYAPGVFTYNNLNAAVPAPVPANGLSPGLDALVKKTAITAAGRPVTRITPHITRVEPEVTYSQVDVPVPVANPVPVKRPVPVQVPYQVTPVVETTEVVQPVVQPVVRQAVTHVAAPALHLGYAGYAGYGLAGYAGESGLVQLTAGEQGLVRRAGEAGFLGDDGLIGYPGDLGYTYGYSGLAHY